MYLFIEANNDSQARLDLISVDEYKSINHISWACDRSLSQTLLKNIDSFIKSNQLSLSDLKGLAVFAGPASFTNLRITHTVANTLAYGLEIAIVNSSAKDWKKDCWQKLNQNQNFKIIKPNYGKQASITLRKK